MGEVKILQVDISGMGTSEARNFCELLTDKIPSDILVIPNMGESGKITEINAADIVYVNGKTVTGEELYNAVCRLKDVEAENEDLKRKLKNLESYTGKLFRLSSSIDDEEDD